MSALRISHLAFTVLLLGQLVLSPKLSLSTDLPDTNGNRIAAAERYLEVVSMKDMMRDMFVESAKNLPKEYRAHYIELMGKNVNAAVLERAALTSMVHHFTVSELNAMTNFYGSKEGKSIMAKFGTYMADIMPTIQQESEKAKVKIKQELEERAREKGKKQ